MEKITLYRFELSHFGEPQNIGFLVGLDEVGLRPELEARLLEPFETLPCPRLRDSVEFWFTQLGYNTYHSDIEKVENAIRDFAWAIERKEKKVSSHILSSAIYTDPYQIALPRSQKTEEIPKDLPYQKERRL